MIFKWLTRLEAAVLLLLIFACAVVLLSFVALAGLANWLVSLTEKVFMSVTVGVESLWDWEDERSGN